MKERNSVFQQLSIKFISLADLFKMNEYNFSFFGVSADGAFPVYSFMLKLSMAFTIHFHSSWTYKNKQKNWRHNGVWIMVRISVFPLKLPKLPQNT